MSIDADVNDGAADVLLSVGVCPLSRSTGSDIAVDADVTDEAA